MSSRTGNPANSGTPLTNPVLVGTTIVVALIVGIFLSYNANKGLPFVQTFPLNAEVPDAQQLVEGSEVRIGGFRVGQVNEIVAVPAEGDKAPYARLEMKLDGTITGLPEDTLVRVRPRSLLGAKYVELVPGDSGKEVSADATLPLDNALETNELDEIFNTFDKPTREGLQGTIRNFGDAVAGRGPDINRAIVATDALLPPLKRVVELLADPRTDLAGFVDKAAHFAAAFAPVADELGVLFDDGATTLAAIDAAGTSFGESIEELPPTQAVALKTLTDLSPALRDLADITSGLRAGTRQLPRSTAALTEALRSGTQVLRRTPELTNPLDTTLETLGVVSRDPASTGAISKLAESLTLLQPSLDSLYAAQAGCNLLAVNLRNQSEAVSRGDQQGTWLSFLPIIDLEQGVRSTGPSPETHFNPYPVMDQTECEAGNEPYVEGQQLGNPASIEPGMTEETRPPEQATALARSAGLLDEIPGVQR
jgi:virulence factor Mce-like protein